MTNQNSKTYISLFVTRTNSLNNSIFKDLAKGKDSDIYKACIELTSLSNEELFDMGYNAIFEFKKNSKGKKVLVKKRQFKNDTTAHKSIIENIDKIAEFAQTSEAKTCKVNGVRGVISKTNAHFNPTVKSEKSQVGTSEKASRTKAEILKNFADIWAKEFNSDLLDLIEFASSEEAQKVCDYSIEKVSKAS